MTSVSVLFVCMSEVVPTCAFAIKYLANKMFGQTFPIYSGKCLFILKVFFVCRTFAIKCASGFVAQWELVFRRTIIWKWRWNNSLQGFTITLEDLSYCDHSSNEFVNLDNLKIWPNLTTSGYIDIQKDMPLAATVSRSKFRIKNRGKSAD